MNNNSFFCLNQTDLSGKTALYGKNDAIAHKRLDILYMPCGSPHDYESGCKNNNTTLEETVKHLQSPNLILMYNHKKINDNKFGDATFTKESIFFNK